MSNRFTVIQKLGDTQQPQQQSGRFEIIQKIDNSNKALSFSKKSGLPTVDEMTQSTSNELKNLKNVSQSGSGVLSGGFKSYVQGNPIPSANPTPSIDQRKTAAENYAKQATAGDGFEKYSLDELEKEVNRLKAEAETNGENKFQVFLNDIMGMNGYRREYEAAKKAYENRKMAYFNYETSRKYGTDNAEEAIELLKEKKKNTSDKFLKDIYDSEIKELRQKLYGDGSVVRHVGNIVSSGVNSWVKAGNATMNFTLGNVAKFLGFKNNIFQQGYDEAKANSEEANRRETLSAKQLGDDKNISGYASTVITAGLDMAPSIIMASLTGGTSMAADAVAKLGLGAKSASLLTAAQTGVRQMAKNPVFYTSFAGELGNNYYEALDSGATEAEATVAAMTSSIINAMIEVGGVQELPKSLMTDKSFGKKSLDFVLSALSEGKEEVLQDFISQITAKAIYDGDKEVFSFDNQEAVINPGRMITEFGVGTVAGGILGGGMLTFNSIASANTVSEYKKTGEAARKLGDIDGVISYAQRSIDADIRALAYNSDSESISDLELGQLYSYACRDIDGAISSPTDLNTAIDNFNEIASSTDSKAINGIALSRLTERINSENLDSEVANNIIESVSQNNLDSESSKNVEGIEKADDANEVNLDSRISSVYNNNNNRGENYGREESIRDGSERSRGENKNSESGSGILQESYERISGNSQEGRRFSKRRVDLRNQRNNRRIEPTDEQVESLKSSAIKNEDGSPKEVFHFTDNMEFETFAKGDIGFHFGTEQQATERGNILKKTGRIIKAYLDIKNPVHISSDIMVWQPSQTALRLFTDNVITLEQYLFVNDLQSEKGGDYNSPAAVELRRILSEKGYDGIAYENLFEGDGQSYIAFYPEQVIITDDGINADLNGSVSFSEKNDVQADKTDIQRDSYAKDKSFWTAENSNEKNEKNSTLVSKLKALFGNEKGDSTVSVGEIVKLIEKDFGIPVSKGKFRQRAYGIYKVKSEAIRTKISNALPTIGHELGHHLDKKYNLRNFQSINEAMRVLKEARPNFYNSYSPEARPGEAVAEFIRNYLADRTLAKRSYPFFYEEFERVLSEKGAEDLNNLKTIGDKINEYFTAEKADRARAAVISREEARKRNESDKEVSDYLEAFETNFVDEAAPLKKISQKAYDLFYYAKKSDVRAHSAIVGDGVASFDGENGGLAYMRDGDGNIIKDSDGKPLNMQPLQKVLAEIDNKSKPDFEMYLVYKHGLEFLENDKRVFADDSINDKEFMSKEIKRFEKAYPQFKKTADGLYSWYKSFIYEYGVKSGLLSKEQYKSLNEKYPCYVPFNRNADGGSKGVKKSVANQKAPIMRAKGSGLEILSPLESITQKVAQFMNAADRNAVMQDIANKADNVEGLGYLLEQVPPDMMPVTVSTESIKKGINEWYKEQSENGNLPDDFTDTIDEIIGDTVTQFVQSNNQGRNVVWVYRNGKKTLYQVHDPNLLTALTGLNKPQFGAFTRAVGNITRLFKVLTTGGNFAWSITSNTPRDFNSAYKYSIEKNPIKFTVDYVRAVISAFSQVRGDKASDIVKLYKTVGGGYNNSLIYNSKELKTTISELIKKDESYLKRFVSRFNLIEGIEQLADFIETAPRLAEFKRVYEQTGDTQKALLAAEEITVNFNRSGSKSKVIDQYIPYFNAGIQGVNKLVSTSLDGEKNKAFFAKTVVSGVITVGLLFAWNMLIMGDDDNDEYEKLSAYKKNNFYNFYIGNGKFFSIPKSKDTAVFDSTLERVFEIALKEDVDYSQEIKDYLSYLWLVFAPPLPTDAIILSTAKDLWRNEDFKGTPIVSSYYEKLEPKEQYNEKTTYIAKALGQITGYSPMKIDHIINSNLGILGLLNKSLGRAEKDWTLGIGTKLITDNAYSSDILNKFYDNADKYEKKANSYPDNAEAVYKNKQYSAAKSVISALNKYGKENPDSALEIKILARDYADSFEKNSGVDKKLLGLLERTGDKDILYDKAFSREYSIDKVKYTMDLEDYLDYVDEYYDEIEKEYDRILSMNVSDEYTAKMLKNAKEEVSDALADKYKVVK